MSRIRKRVARSLIKLARRLDPPSDPYAEWDAEKGALIVKLPDGAGNSLPLASVNIGAGQIQSTVGPKEWKP